MKEVLCACSAYNNKYWLNEKYEKLPIDIKKELKIMCVLFVEKVGGIISLKFDDNNILFIDIEHAETDYMYDEIGAGLEIRRLQKEKEELFNQLQLFDYAIGVF